MGGKASRAWRAAARRAEREAWLAEQSIFFLLVTVVAAVQQQHGQGRGRADPEARCHAGTRVQCHGDWPCDARRRSQAQGRLQRNGERGLP
jgi:hypothetical protein